MNKEFEKELTRLINRYSIENDVDMPDFLLARMLCAMIEGMGPSIKATLDWHGCDSVCHPQQVPAGIEIDAPVEFTEDTIVEYAHKQSPSGHRYRQFLKYPLPEWAVDIWVVPSSPCIDIGKAREG